MHRTTLLLALLAACAVGVPAGRASAQGLSGTVQAQVDTAIVLFAAEGLQRTGEVHSGSLPQGASRALSVNVPAGALFAVAGVCDGACSDLDLVLSDARRIPVALDTEPDGFPVLVLQSPRPGPYALRVEMVACAAAACEWAVALFTQP
jgi:hypothetical protein